MKADWLEAGEALSRILAAVDRLDAVEVRLGNSLGHVLAEPVVSEVNLPPWDNSAMDGFAVRSRDLDQSPLPVSDDVPAGGFPRGPLAPGTAARVMTGAPVPDGADGVIRVEHVHEIGGPGNEWKVELRETGDAGRNIRLRGEDISRGQTVLAAGTPLRAAHLAVAASVGRPALQVVRRPRVAILATGDELVDVDRFDEVRAGRRIVSSNSYALAAQLRESGCEPVDLGIARDDPASIEAALRRAADADAVITSAGVSVGEHDHLKEILAGLGLEHGFWRARIRPGSPLAFGRIEGLGGIPWFGLPGNPVSTLVTFEVFVRPALHRMAGEPAPHLPTIPVRFAGEYGGKAGLTHFVRARLQAGGDGKPADAVPTGGQGSGILTSMALADVLVVISPDPGSATRGDELTAIRLGGRPLSPDPPV
jgi:molybdopterin molybdotransferase